MSYDKNPAAPERFFVDRVLPPTQPNLFIWPTIADLVAPKREDTRWTSPTSVQC